jgi:tRNA1Val (adenine37-N6)-methyltransferase
MSAFFRFKQFTIHHDKTSMKVGTDGVLLGAWANPKSSNTILDIGTGTGVIALMMAQRSLKNCTIVAVELEPDAFNQALENVRQSPWPQKIQVHQSAIQDFTTDKKFDLIISNPPYFQNSQKPPDEKRIQTRHTVTLSFQELIHAVVRLLDVNGKFNVILPYQEGLSFIALANQNQLYCTRQWSFRTRKEKPIERWLLEFAFKASPVEKGEVVLYDSGEEWSEDYKSLTRDFYLKL